MGFRWAKSVPRSRTLSFLSEKSEGQLLRDSLIDSLVYKQRAKAAINSVKESDCLEEESRSWIPLQHFDRKRPDVIPKKLYLYCLERVISTLLVIVHVRLFWYQRGWNFLPPTFVEFVAPRKYDCGSNFHRKFRGTFLNCLAFVFFSLISIAKVSRKV